MAKKQEKEQLNEELQDFCFPAEGVTVKAKDQNEALKKLKELLTS